MRSCDDDAKESLGDLEWRDEKEKSPMNMNIKDYQSMLRMMSNRKLEQLRGATLMVS